MRTRKAWRADAHSARRAGAGRVDYALADYQHSLELKSNQPAVLDSIANIEWKQGRQADALAAWQLAVKGLAAELDNRMPPSFWEDFARVVTDVAKNGQYATISQQVDAMLRVYLKRNGEYRAVELLGAGYHAHGDSMEYVGREARVTDQRQLFGLQQLAAFYAPFAGAGRVLRRCRTSGRQQPAENGSGQAELPGTV